MFRIFFVLPDSASRASTAGDVDSSARTRCIQFVTSANSTGPGTRPSSMDRRNSQSWMRRRMNARHPSASNWSISGRSPSDHCRNSARPVTLVAIPSTRATTADLAPVALGSRRSVATIARSRSRLREATVARTTRRYAADRTCSSATASSTSTSRMPAPASNSATSERKVIAPSLPAGPASTSRAGSGVRIAGALCSGRMKSARSNTSSHRRPGPGPSARSP